MIPLAEVNNGWQQTWQHPSLQDAINTSLSLDHLAAEAFMEFVTGSIGFVIGRKLLKRHDRKHHRGHTAGDGLERQIGDD